MIEIKTNESEKYIYIEISGHAGFDRAGRDIVCAAVSMLYQCFLQTVDDQGLVSCEFDDDVHAVRVIRCEETEHYYNMLMTGLKMLAEQFGEFVAIKGEK